MELDLQTIGEWRKLGYYYEYEKDLKQWRFYGSKQGLKSLIKDINVYIDNPANNTISEHIHLGPHNYLKIMTWHNAIISEKYIAGTLSELKMLRELVEDNLMHSRIGETFIIGRDYSSNTTVTMLFIVMAKGFDPASIEFENSSFV